jgi:nucleoside-diphosphate-sugar epimerase
VKVLVTGASGFLGRHVVAELLRRGHSVRALLRAGSEIGPWTGRVEVVRGDLRAPDALIGVAGDADAVLHLAAPVTGDPEDAFTTAVVGTENLIAALKESPVQRLILASSIAVYDWSVTDGTITEDTPLVRNPWPRGGYTVAKLWQERVSRRGAAEHGIALTILRPGFIWGRGHDALAGIGQSIGRVHFVVSGGRRLPATYVENCAHCFGSVLEDGRAAGRVYNVVDSPGSSAWRYMGAYLRGTDSAGVRVPVPYAAARGAALVAATAAHQMFEHGGRLPSLLDLPRLEARFKPVECTSARLQHELDWRPPVTFEDAVRRTYGTTTCAPW